MSLPTFRRGLIVTSALVFAALTAGLAEGCGSAGQGAKSASAIGVSERDFHISAPDQVSAGEVVFTVHNHGPDRHELIIASANSSLPLRTDGLTINEEVLEKREVGELEPGAPGSVRTLRLHLRPGRYVMFCNMAGHFLGGMHHELVVR
jgi:uncharacterized cupredoxin-like copper-binding protein